MRYQPSEDLTAQNFENGAEARVWDFLKQNYLVTDSQALRDDDSFLEQGILDSTSVLELVAYLESTFGIRVKDEELVPENLDSVSRVAAFVRHKRRKSNGSDA